MRYLFAAFLILIILPDAFAQHMRDMSLTPEESFQQSVNSTEPLGAGIPGLGQENGTPTPNTAASPISRDGLAGGYMTSYCDPNVKPVIGSGAMQTCIISNRQKICDTFQHLPADAKQVLDHAISCADKPAPDAAGYIADPTCVYDDRTRLTLAKKYWRDQNTVYALLFLPDMALTASTSCTGNP